MVEFLPSKQNVAGSSPVIRSKPDRLAFEDDVDRLGDRAMHKTGGLVSRN